MTAPDDAEFDGPGAEAVGIALEIVTEYGELTTQSKAFRSGYRYAVYILAQHYLDRSPAYDCECENYEVASAVLDGAITWVCEECGAELTPDLWCRRVIS